MVAEIHAEPWRSKWGADDAIWKRPNFEKVNVKTFLKLRQQHLEEAKGFANDWDVTPAAVKKALGLFREKTSVGCANLKFRTLHSLPAVAHDQLASIFLQSVTDLTLPIQCLLNILNLLGKKSGGSRTVATMPSYYRILMKLLGTNIRDWDIENGHPFDSALAGCSPLRAAVMRALKMENSAAHQLHGAHLLWDMDKFYDSIHLEALASELIDR